MRTGGAGPACRDGDYWRRLAVVSCHVPVKLRDKLDQVAGEIGCKPSEIVQEGIELCLYLACEAGTYQGEKEWRDLAKAQQEEIDDLKERLRQLDEHPCLTCGGSGVQAIPEEGPWKERIRRAKEVQKVLESPYFVPLIHAVLGAKRAPEPDSGGSQAASEPGEAQNSDGGPADKPDPAEAQVVQVQQESAGGAGGPATGVSWIDSGEFKPRKAKKSGPPTFEVLS